MSFSSPPEFPIPCRVWLNQSGPTPAGPADYSSTCSVSPSKPADWARAEALVGLLATDIIRMPKDDLLIDNTGAGIGANLYPCSIIEAPSRSGNFYSVIWTHIVGRGFPNEFRRAVCYRAVPNFSGPFPP